MPPSFPLVKPRYLPPLDEDFRPAVLANRRFEEWVAETGGPSTGPGPAGVPLILGLERSNGELTRFETRLLPANHPQAGSNLMYAERLLKFLLWARGGWKVYVGGPKDLADQLARIYSPSGERAFDYHFMGEQVYEHPFTVIHCAPEAVPPANERGRPLGRHLDGCRIGFDLGASDRKVSAVVDGTAVFSEEVVWEPRKNADPEYHYHEIMAALRTAASKMPRVDAIGGSSAGIYIDNRPMVASLFRGVPKEQYHKVHDLFLRICRELGVPLEIINDGDVTALAGSMSLEDNGILGIALGSSQAAGYVDMDGHIVTWLSELAFAPVDYQPDGALDEWSQDRGVGSQYFSQQCVFRLAPRAGIEIPQNVTDAEKLKFVQEKLEAGHEGALKIWQSMGVYMGYGIAHYADFYPVRHVLILGRCTSGRGGQLILDGANEVLKAEFPELGHIHIQLPDEKSRRVGQSIAAASLPVIPK